MYVIFAALAIFFFAIPKVWAKRSNWLVVTLTVAYTVKTFYSFTSCYSGICPVKQIGIYILVLSVAIMFAAALLPDLKVKQ